MADEDKAVAAIASVVDDMDARELQRMEAGEDLEVAEGQAPAKEDDSEAKDVAEVEEVEGDEKEAEKKPQEEPKAPVVDWRLRHNANRAGWTDEDIQTLLDTAGDKAIPALEKIADGFDAVSSKWSESGQAKAAQGEKEAAKDADAFDINKPLDRKGLLEKVDGDGDPIFSEEALGVLGPMFDAFESMRGVVAQLHGRVTPYLQEQEEASQAKDWETLEGFFEEVAGDYGEVFGKGKTPDLGENTEEHKARVALWEKAKLIAAGYQSLGQKFDLKGVLKDALSVTQAGRQQELARNKLRDDLKKRGKQITARPKGRAAQPSDPEEAAVNAIAGIVTDLGI